MIKKVTVTNRLLQSVVLDLRNPATSGFFVRGISGLGPPKAVINTTESLLLDGSTFNSSRAQQRNIVFDLGFIDWPTIEDARQHSYIHFPLKGKVDVVIETDLRTVKTFGYVESNEPNIFTNDAGTIISVICPSAYFKALDTIVVDFSNVERLFEFPFSNESLTENLIIFSNLIGETEKNIPYSGEVPVGIKMIIDVAGLVDDLVVWNLGTQQSMSLSTDILTALTGSGLVAGDRVIINTKTGEKSVMLLRDGNTINILNALGPESDWFTLQQGDNVFFYTAEFGLTNVSFTIEHEVHYEGI